MTVFSKSFLFSPLAKTNIKHFKTVSKYKILQVKYRNLFL